jgi:hypothetical protein
MQACQSWSFLYNGDKENIDKDARGDQYPECLSREFPPGERELNTKGEFPSVSEAFWLRTSLLQGSALAVKEPVRPLTGIMRPQICGESRWHHERPLVLLARGVFN